MPILPRYFLRIFLPLFGLSLSVFAGVLVMNHFLKIFNLAVMKGISPLWVVGCFARLLPFILSLATPMAFVVALLLTFGQLAEGGELTALRASGFSFTEMTWPLLAVASLLSGGLLYLNHKASPEGYHAFRNRMAAAGEQISRVQIEPNTFMQVGPWKLYAQSVDGKTGELAGVYFLRVKGGSIRIEAKSGRLAIDQARGFRLELRDGDLVLPNTDPARFTSGRFESYLVELPASGALKPRNMDMQEMNSSRLIELIRATTTAALHKIEYPVEISLRTASALSPFVFFWIGAPLGLSLGRHSRSRGFAIALGMLFVYYGLTAFGIATGRRNPRLSWLSPFTADAVLLAAGAFLTRKAALK